MTGPAPEPLALPAYRASLRAVLDGRSDAVRAKLRDILAALPAEAVEVGIDVFPDQDGEGTFDVWLRLEGPDVYVLNRAVEPWRHLFGVVFTETSTDPELPLLERTAGVDVSDVVVDVAADWVEALWTEVTDGQAPLACRFEGEHGYGTTTPRTVPRGTDTE